MNYIFLFISNCQNLIQMFLRVLRFMILFYERAQYCEIKINNSINMLHIFFFPSLYFVIAISIHGLYSPNTRSIAEITRSLPSWSLYQIHCKVRSYKLSTFNQSFLLRPPQIVIDIWLFRLLSEINLLGFFCFPKMLPSSQIDILCYHGIGFKDVVIKNSTGMDLMYIYGGYTFFPPPPLLKILFYAQ